MALCPKMAAMPQRLMMAPQRGLPRYVLCQRERRQDARLPPAAYLQAARPRVTRHDMLASAPDHKR